MGSVANREIKILVVDPDPVGKSATCKILDAEKYTVLQAGNAERALELFDEHKPQIVVTEYRFSGITGQELVDQVKQKVASTGILMFTNEAPGSALINLIRYERLMMLRKPIKQDQFIETIEKLRELTAQYSGPENRKYRRVPASMQVDLGTYGVGTLVNLSAGGVFVGTEAPLNLGDILDMKFPALNDLLLKGEVRRRVDAKAAEAIDFPQGVGIEFKGITAEQLAILGKFIFQALKT